MLKRLALLAPVLLLTVGPAFAHLDPVDHGSFPSGFSHPLFGIDHIVVMVAVGLWAATIGGRSLWMIPATFVGAMAVGYLVSLSGLTLPFVEPVILASAVVLVLLVGGSVRLPVPIGAALVGVFALFHGHAHGTELGGTTALAFGVGFALSTVLLHSAGIGLGLLLGLCRAMPGRGAQCRLRSLLGRRRPAMPEFDAVDERFDHVALSREHF